MLLLRSSYQRLSICCENKEINFFQDTGDSTSFDLERVTKDGINNDQIIMAVYRKHIRKATFLLLLAVWYLHINQQ